MKKGLFHQKISRKNSYQLTKLKEGQKIPIVSSTMFEVMLNNESRKRYVSYLLSLALNQNLDDIMNTLTFMKAELDKSNYHYAKKTVDFVCEVDDMIYNIELNNNMEVVGLERNISYIMDLYKSKMFRGSDYQYQNVVQININNFTFEGKEETIESYHLQNEKGQILTEKIEIIYIYLPKIREKYYNKEKLSEMEKLLLVFNEQDSKELQSLMEGNEIMEQYHFDASEASKKEEIIGLYDKELYDEMMEYHKLKHAKEEGIERGIEKGIKKGIEKGIEKGKREKELEIAKKLRENHIDIELISISTGLTKGEIENL